MFILDDLLLKLPAKGFMGILTKIVELAEEEFTDEASIKEDLLLIQTLYEMDQLSDEEYQRRESELLERLNMVREMKEESHEEEEE